MGSNLAARRISTLILLFHCAWVASIVEAAPAVIASKVSPTSRPSPTPSLTSQTLSPQPIDEAAVLKQALVTGDLATAERIAVKRTSSPSATPRDWMSLGNIRFKQKEYQAALLAYDKVSPEDPELFALAGLGRSRAYRAQGNFKKSVEEFQKIDDPHTQAQLSKQLRNEKSVLHESLNAMGLDFIKARRYTDALSTLQQASGLKGSAENQALLGWTYFELEQWQKAVDYFERIVEQPEGKPYWDEAEQYINLVLGKRNFIGFAKPFLNLQMGVGYNSNFLYEPISLIPTVKGYEGRLSVLGGADWLTKGNWSSSVAYQAGLAESLKMSSNRYLNHGFLVPISRTQARFKLSITPSYTWSIQNSDLTSSKFRVRADVTLQKLRSQWGYGLAAARNWVQNAKYPYMQGYSFEGSTFWRRLMSDWSWVVRFPVSREIMQDSSQVYPFTYWAVGAEGTIDTHLGGEWFYEPQMTLTFARYDRLFDSDPIRVDQRLSFSNRLMRNLSSTSDVYLSFEYYFQQSNYPIKYSDQRLRQFAVGVGIDTRF